MSQEKPTERTKISINPTRTAYEFRVRYEGRLKAGDYYTVDENGEKTLVWPENVVSTLNSGSPVFMSVGNGKCRELSLANKDDLGQTAK